MEKERELPEIEINGRPWLVDANGYRIVDKQFPNVYIDAFEMSYTNEGYRFDLLKRIDRIARWPERGEDILLVQLDHFTKMDPEGVALKYGLPVDQVRGKTDYEIMEDKQALIDRLRGRLTTVDIAGHTFYVDFPMQMLRPKDNFLSDGIPFAELDDYYNEDTGHCDVSYNKRLQQWEFVDCTDIVRQPKDIIIVSFPTPEKLDPVGYARYHGFHLGYALEENPQKAHFKAKILKGEDSWLDYIIDDNRKRLGLPKRPQRRNKGLGL